jgi:phospholipase C
LRICICVMFLLGCSGPVRLPVGGLSDDEARALRRSCAFKPGALARDTLGMSARLGGRMPIDHVVLIMQENRSFDHYFSRLSHGGVVTAPLEATNPDGAGAPVMRYHEPRYCLRDPAHGWNASHRQHNGGKNDGFVVTNEPDGARALAWYDESDLPYYYALARTFAISDAHFASVMGPTQPNRLYYWAGTSFGRIVNTLPPVQDETGKRYPNLFTRLDAAGVSWKIYSKKIASPAVFLAVFSERAELFRPIDDFFADLAAEALPSVAVVEANFEDGVPGNEDDEHPEANMQLGQAFTASVVNAMIASSAWPRSAVFLSYDEHGGFYDSVAPPAACEPDALTPIGDDTRRFDHYGFRVPLIAISPYVRRGYVSHEVSDHTSVIRFLSARFGLPAMTARDANADALLDMFDFSRPNFEKPELAEAVVDPVKLAKCRADFPP